MRIECCAWCANATYLLSRLHLSFTSESPSRNAVVKPLRKVASYEPRIAILGIWGDTWLTRGKYGIYVVVTGPLRGLRDAFWKVERNFKMSCLLHDGNEDTLVSAA